MPERPRDVDSLQSVKDIFLHKNGYEIDDRFVIRDGREHPLAILCPGGGYAVVCSFIEGVPIAKKLNEKGISAVIVYYRVKRQATFPNPQDDLARGIREVLKRKEEYRVRMEDYSIWGSSAGGHLVATFGTKGMGYEKYNLPKPGALVLIYPVITMDKALTHMGSHDLLLGKYASEAMERMASVERHVDADYPDTFLWCGDADQTVPPENTKGMAAALEEAGVRHECRIYPGVDHGVGPGTGTAAEGWIDEAVSFWLPGFSHGVEAAKGRQKNTQAFNPYLPGYEYVPDGEPRVFGDRLYVYGSHDRFDGPDFCVNDYVCWSAPLSDLADWRYEGVIYRASQDARNVKGDMHMCAPDVVQGPDGRYYLYYEFHRITVTSVAVCDTPAGKYEFYGYIQKKDGTPYGETKGEVNLFDPGVLVDDDGRIYMYTGFAPLPGWMKTAMEMRGLKLDAGYCVELEQDMITMKGEPVSVIPGPSITEGTGFEGHGFFEASSIRKIGDTYYLVYSSELSHELCYATSKKPDADFRYGGTLVSIGDIGYQGNTTPLNYTGNTHGGMVEVNGQWYIFYHRQTNKQKCARQGCAEKITIAPYGSIAQAEVTSCGLNDGPLKGKGIYSAGIACNLSSREGTFAYLKTREKDKKGIHPYFTQSGADREYGDDQYIANMTDGSWAGFKYFAFSGEESRIAVRARGRANGVIRVSTERGGEPVAKIALRPCREFRTFAADISLPGGTLPLYFKYDGEGAFDFEKFQIK